MKSQKRSGCCLTIAGSDSGGNAGVQADLRAFHAYGLHGCTVFAALTAQNPFGVSAIHAIPADFVGAQLDAVLGTYDIRALKTGMLAEPAIIETVAERLARHPEIAKVVDPVMIATSGAKLISDAAIVTLKARLELGAGAEEGTFDAADQVGVMAVTTQDGTAYLFKTAEGVVTNVSASAEPGAETEVEILADYARRTVRYVIGGETNGPFALPAGAQRANAVNLGGSGNLKYLNGDYEIMGLNTNLAASGGAEYATVAEAVAAGGPVTLLWDASWVPTEGGDYSFVSNGHELKVGGDLAFEVKDNGDGTVTVTVPGMIEEPKPATIALKDGKVVIGVANPDPKSSYVLARAARLGDEFVPDESTLKTGAELLSGASLEALVTPGVTSEFFKIFHQITRQHKCCSNRRIQGSI